MRFSTRTLTVAAALTALTLCATSAFADGPAAAPPAPPAPPAGAAAAPAVEITDAAREEARAHYQKALGLFDDGAFDAAMLEFRKAYDRAPSYRILYNFGVTSERLKDFVSAIHYYERFLSEGGDQVKDDQKQVIRDQVQLLKGRIGKLTIKVNVPGATISIDDVPVTDGVLVGRQVNSGRRRVSASLPPTYAPTSKVVDIPGGDLLVVDLVLEKSTIVVKESAHIPWIGIFGTVAFTGAAIATGVVALGAGSKYDDMVADRSGKVGPADLDSQRSKTRGFSLATDLLAVGAIGFAVYTVYDIVRAKPSASADTTPKAIITFPRGGVTVGTALTF